MTNQEATLQGDAIAAVSAPTDKRYFVRLNYSERLQHMIFAACFIVLVITGFMLKIPEDLVKTFGVAGETIFQYRSLLHRTAGTVMIIISLYHVYYLIFKPAGRRWLMDMLPRLKDLKDLRDIFLYYFSINDQPPEFDRFCYKHKIEYLGLIAGTVIMSATGLMLWTQYRWSKFAVDIATVVHGMEAILACLVVMVWHLYEVHLRPHKSPLDNTWLTGVIEEAEMKEEHPLHYQKIINDPEFEKIYIQRDS
jgi:cytochrome b subunit of formate dehydrogenase